MPDAAGRTAWPLSSEQRTIVVRLGELIRRHGAARFTQAHLVRADERDFPDPWEPNLSALYGLLYRLFWHAYLDPEIVIDDVRGRGQSGLLTNSVIDFIETNDGRVTFQVAAFGNDDVAGLLSHAVGTAFLALAPADPFREIPTATSATDASIAACYLGLGVLVANASMYRRYRSRLVGREVRSENRIETTGGLSIADATLLLAVQLTVRDDVPDAVETLHGPQKEWIDRWTEILDPHEDELRTLLGLDDASASAALPDRAAQPRVPPAVAEPALPTHNQGLMSFRVPRERHRMWAGLGLGIALAVVGWLVFGESVALFVLLPIGAVGGRLVRRPGFACFACEASMATELEVCPNCRVSLKDTLATRALRKARRAEWAAQSEQAIDPEYAEEAERAYHPDV
jgi:hypothetical protein